MQTPVCDLLAGALCLAPRAGFSSHCLHEACGKNCAADWSSQRFLICMCMVLQCIAFLCAVHDVLWMSCSFERA